jgi:fatty-acyl-CoA synthase
LFRALWRQRASRKAYGSSTTRPPFRSSIAESLKDLIIRGGENIYPREIEDLVFTHPAVANAAVVGVPDREWGEVAVAFVQIKAEAAADEAELTAFCRAKLASYKVPRIWRFVDQFPQTGSGKIQKFALRNLLLNSERP